jgi:hypothetical protein
MISIKDKLERVPQRFEPKELAGQETARLEENGNIKAVICKIYIIVNCAIYTPTMHFNNILSRFLHKVWASDLFDKSITKVVLWCREKNLTSNLHLTQ